MKETNGADSIEFLTKVLLDTFGDSQGMCLFCGADLQGHRVKAIRLDEAVRALALANEDGAICWQYWGQLL